MATINQCWAGDKLQIVRSVLESSTSDNYAQICAHLLSSAFSDRYHALGGGFGTDSNIFSDILHCGSQAISFCNRPFHSSGLFGTGFNGLSQTPCLQAEHNKLEKTNYGENGCSKDEPASEFNQFPIIRRFFFAVFGLFSGFYISLRGWHLSDNQRKLLGATLVGIGWLVGAIGLGLLWLTAFPQTWGWSL